MKQKSEPLKETRSDICLLCGKPKGDSKFALICQACYDRFSAKTKIECEYWNDNGMFCELTGLDCVGSDCQSYYKII